MNQRMKLRTDLAQWRKSTALVTGFCLIAVIGICDYLSGYQLSLSILYLIPVSLLAWTTGRWSGIGGALLSACVWVAADIGAGQHFLSPFSVIWHVVTRTGVLGTSALLFAALRRSMEHEKALARIDHLTGAANTRSFQEILRTEIERSRRYQRPFTLAYIDLDNFKSINDSLGHTTGDLLLQTVVRVIRSHARSTDVVARLGGDEFAVLLPEADERASRAAITKMRESLVMEMGRRGWPVTVSVGALTIADSPVGVEELLKQVDDLMYKAKMTGKNAITFSSQVLR
jgi:diguanylate cyclase (GGDEF)-like protein